MREVTVTLKWLILINGKLTPKGRHFTLPAKFDHQDHERSKNDAWSLIIDLVDTPDRCGNQLATARFLVPNAPHEWLSAGRTFTLFEGTHAWAEGRVDAILPSCDQ